MDASWTPIVSPAPNEQTMIKLTQPCLETRSPNHDNRMNFTPRRILQEKNVTSAANGCPSLGHTSLPADATPNLKPGITEEKCKPLELITTEHKPDSSPQPEEEAKSNPVPEYANHVRAPTLMWELPALSLRAEESESAGGVAAAAAASFAFAGGTGDPVSPTGNVKGLVDFFHLTEAMNSPPTSPHAASPGSPCMSRFKAASLSPGPPPKTEADATLPVVVAAKEAAPMADVVPVAEQQDSAVKQGDGGSVKREPEVALDVTPSRPQMHHPGSVFHVPLSESRSCIGREDDLQAVYRLLTSPHSDGKSEEEVSSSGGNRVVSIQGWAGQGKSHLALTYSHRHRGEYPKGVLWVNAGHDWEENFAALCPVLGIPADDFGRSMLMDRVRFAREVIEEGGYLLILDNVAETGEGLGEMLPMKGDVHVLITTCAQFLPEVDVLQYELKCLSVDSAVKVLRMREDGTTRMLSEVEDMCLVYIAKQLSCLPLALNIAARLLDTGMSARDLLERIRKEPPVLPEDLQSSKRLFQKTSSLTQVLRLSLEQLEDDARSGSETSADSGVAIAMFEIAGWLSSFPISMKFLWLASLQHRGGETAVNGECTPEGAVRQLQKLGLAGPTPLLAGGEPDMQSARFEPALQTFSRVRTAGHDSAAAVLLSMLAAMCCTEETLPHFMALWERRRELHESGHNISHILSIGLHLASLWTLRGCESRALSTCDEVLSGYGSYELEEYERDKCLVDAMRELEEARWQQAPGGPQIPQMRWRFQFLRAEIFQRLSLDPIRADEQLRVCFDGMDDELKNGVPGFLILATRAMYMMRRFPYEDENEDEPSSFIWDVGRHDPDSGEAADALQLAAHAKNVLVFGGLLDSPQIRKAASVEGEEFRTVNETCQLLGTGLMSLATCFYDNSHVKVALDIYRQALRLRQRALPPQHPNLLQSYGELSGVLLELQRRMEVMEWLQETAALLDHELQQVDLLHPVFAQERLSAGAASEPGSPLSGSSPSWATRSPRSISTDSNDFPSSPSTEAGRVERGLPLASAVGLVRRMLYDRSRLQEDVSLLLEASCTSAEHKNKSILETALSPRQGLLNLSLSTSLLRLVSAVPNPLPPCLPEIRKALEMRLDEVDRIPAMRDVSDTGEDSSMDSRSNVPSPGSSGSFAPARPPVPGGEELYCKNTVGNLWALACIYRSLAKQEPAEDPRKRREAYLAEARDSLLQALDLVKKGIPAEAETTEGGLLLDLAVVCMDQGEHQEAQEHLERTLVLWEACYGTDTPRAGDVMALLAVVQFRQAQADKQGVPSVASVDDDSIDSAEAVIVERALNLTKVLVYIGRVLLAGGRAQDALATLGKALAIREQLLPDLHPEIVESLLDLGSTIARQPREQMAEERESLIEILSQVGPTLLDSSRVSDAQRCMQMLLVLRQQANPDSSEPDQEQEVAESLLDTASRMERRKCSTSQERKQAKAVAKEMKKEALTILSRSKSGGTPHAPFPAPRVGGYLLRTGSTSSTDTNSDPLYRGGSLRGA